MCYDNNKTIYVLMNEKQQKLERDLNPYDIHSVDEVADSLLCYKYNLEYRSWKKLPNFWNMHYWKGDLMETYIHDLCTFENKLCIRTEGWLDRGGFNYLRVDAKEPDW